MLFSEAAIKRMRIFKGATSHCLLQWHASICSCYHLITWNIALIVAMTEQKTRGVGVAAQSNSMWNMCDTPLMSETDFYVDIHKHKSSQTYAGIQMHALLLSRIAKKHGRDFYLKHDRKFRLWKNQSPNDFVELHVCASMTFTWSHYQCVYVVIFIHQQ